jgi:CheY-like chemotaxis protein
MTPDRLRLDGIRTLVADGDPAGGALLLEMLRGLGFTSVKLAETAKAAQAALEQDGYDLCLCDAALPDAGGADLIRAVRAAPAPLRFLPILAMTGYAAEAQVLALRDAGAHLVMKKPLSPQSLYDRLAWVAQPRRAFIESPAYVGPDRRFRCLGPPGGIGRRATDLSIEIGAATEPNLSQDEIDSLIKPMKVMAE